MRAVYCDLDGTLIKGDLEQEFLKYLRYHHYFKVCNYFGALLSIPLNYMRKKKYKGSLLKSWTIGFTKEELESMFCDFFKHANSELKINSKTWQLLEDLKSDYRIVLLTGSHEQLVFSFLKYNGLYSFFDEIIGCQMHSNGYLVKAHPYGIEKCNYIIQENSIIGIANEIADCFYLALCDEVFIIEGDSQLEKVARKNKWRIL